MAKIGKKTLDAVAEQVRKLLQDYGQEIDEAFQIDDGKYFQVNLVAKFMPGRNDGIGHFATISFVKEKCKDETSPESTDENGPTGDPLFDQDDKERARLRAILFRDFRPLARLIGRTLAKWRHFYQNVGAAILRKHFEF